MGFLDDLMQGSGRKPSMSDRATEIADVAMQNGFVTPLDPRFAQQYPDLAQEWQQLVATQASGMLPFLGVGTAGAGAGMLPAAASASRGAPQGALPPPRGIPGEVINSRPAPPPPGIGAPGPVIEGSVVPPGSAPPGGTIPNVSSTVPGTGPKPYSPSPAGPPPPGGPAAPPSPNIAAGGPAASPAQSSGMLQSVWNAIQANPIVAGAGALATGAVVGAGAATRVNAAEAQRRQDAPGFRGFRIPEQLPPDMAAAADEERRKKEKAEADTQRARDAETSLVEAQAAYARAQHAELDRRTATMDLTDSEKEKLHADLQAKLDAANNEARQRNTETTEAGATARNAASIAGEARNTDVREAGATARSQAQIAGEARNTDVREAGATARTGYEGQVTQRGQDMRGREAEGQFISSMLANRINEGTLSLNRATKIWEAYVQQAKLPSEILKNVSDSVQPFLPYMTNRSAGDAIPGFERGGAMERLTKMGGGKYDPSKYKGTSNFSLTDLAAQYGGGPGQSSMPPQSVDQTFAGAGQVAQESIANPNSAPPPMVQQPSSPMSPEAQQRILNGLGQ